MAYWKTGLDFAMLEADQLPGMTLSGNLTKWQQRAIWLRPAAFGFFTGGLLLAFVWTILRDFSNVDPGLRLVALAFGPLVGMTGFALGCWINRDTVVEFTCDGAALRFRKLGSAREEVRGLSEIVAIEEMTRNREVSGCRARFRDGVEAAFPARSLPDGFLIGDWLRAHRDSRSATEFRISPAQSEQSWQPPLELTRPAPRPVRLSGAGVMLGLITVFIVVAGGDGLLWLAQDSRRQEAQVGRMFEEGREVQGVVTRLIETHGRGPHYHVRY